MSKLKAAAPKLEFDADKLRRWGFAWRVGTKATKKASGDVDEPEEEEDGSEGPDAEGDDEAAPEGAENKPTPATPMTVEGAGVPAEWLDFMEEAKKPCAFNKKQGMDFGVDFDRAVGAALADMLGDIPIVDHVDYQTEKKALEEANRAARKAAKAGGAKLPAAAKIALKSLAWTEHELLPPSPNCVEVGPARIIGGIRPQNFDVVYRPDGPRIAYDSKSLNDTKSIQKNWQNMVNDLGTEATTVHVRFPYAIVAFIVAVPKQAIRPSQLTDIVRTLERLATRVDVDHPAHLAEAISFVVWDVETGQVDESGLSDTSCLRLSNFMQTIHERYVERYKGLPPHEK